MSSSKAAWGIEVGAGAVKAIKLERSGSNVTVTDFAYIEHKKVLTTPDLDQNEVIRLSLGQLISQKNFENERIVMSYELLLGETRISVSLGTTEIAPTANGARLTYTEQGAYLDGYDDAGQREHGTRELLGQLEAFLNT